MIRLPRPLTTVARILLGAASRARRHRADWCLVITAGPRGVEVSGNVEQAPAHVREAVAERVRLALG